MMTVNLKRYSLYKKGLRKNVIFLFILFIYGSLSGLFFSVQAYKVERYVFCSDVDPDTHEPIGINSIFYSTNDTVCFWVNVSDISPGRTLRFDWYDPDDNWYDSREKIVESSMDGQSHDWYVSWSAIRIKGMYPEKVPGMWKVIFNIDEKMEASLSFELIDLQSTYGIIKNLLTSINNLKNQIDKITSDYEILFNNYNSILLEYNTLNNNYEKLLQEYSDVNENYTIVYNDYISIKSRYESTLTSLNTTTMMMYASLGFGILSFTSLIIFSLMSRRTTIRNVPSSLHSRKQKGKEKIIEDDTRVKIDVTKVRGIGPKTAEKLGEIGIEFIDDLMIYNPKYLSDKIGVSREIVSRWIEHAEELLLQETQ